MPRPQYNHERFVADYNRRFIDQHRFRPTRYHKALLGGTVTYFGKQVYDFMSRRVGVYNPESLITPIKKALRETPETISPVKGVPMDIDVEFEQIIDFYHTNFGGRKRNAYFQAQKSLRQTKARRFKKRRRSYH